MFEKAGRLLDALCGHGEAFQGGMADLGLPNSTGVVEGEFVESRCG